MNFAQSVTQCVNNNFEPNRIFDLAQNHHWRKMSHFEGVAAGIYSQHSPVFDFRVYSLNRSGWQVPRYQYFDANFSLSETKFPTKIPRISGIHVSHHTCYGETPHMSNIHISLLFLFVTHIPYAKSQFVPPLLVLSVFFFQNESNTLEQWSRIPRA